MLGFSSAQLLKDASTNAVNGHMCYKNQNSVVGLLWHSGMAADLEAESSRFDSPLGLL